MENKSMSVTSTVLLFCRGDIYLSMMVIIKMPLLLHEKWYFDTQTYGSGGNVQITKLLALTEHGAVIIYPCLWEGQC